MGADQSTYVLSCGDSLMSALNSNVASIIVKTGQAVLTTTQEVR